MYAHRIEMSANTIFARYSWLGYSLCLYNSMANYLFTNCSNISTLNGNEKFKHAQ